MSQNTPNQPNQPGQPSWAQQPQQHAPWPQPQPPKKNTGKFLALGCVGFAVLGIVAFAGCTAVVGKAVSDAASSAPSVSVPNAPAAKAPKGNAPASAVKLSATTTKFTPSILHNGGAFTSVKVTVTNNSKDNVDVNLLYFAVTDTHGTKHTTDALGEDKNQIDTVTLSPGENVTGVVTAQGTFTPKTITYTNDLIGDSYTADVK